MKPNQIRARNITKLELAQMTLLETEITTNI